MKKRVAAACLASASALAWGQSSVSLYGIVDTGIEFYNNAAKGGSFVGMPTLTGEVPSRFGLRGQEDLGGGYKAFFVLENGFAANSGALNYGGRLFGRQANLGISSDYGTLTLGRQMNMSMYVLLNADVIGPSIHSMASFDSYLPNARSDNAVGYLGKFHGVTVGGTYSFGRDAAGPAGPSATNCGGQLAGDAVGCRQYTMMLAYDSAWGGAAASYDVMYGGPGASAPLVSSADTDKRVIVDGYVKFGSGKIGGGWIRRNTAAATHAQSDLFFLGANYYLTPTVAFDAQALRYILREQSSSTLLVARANYFISKRTTLYASLGYMLNSALAANAVAAAGTVTTGANQFGAMMGIQQRF
ncbi:porin [Paraburkholderia tropica]|uniref:Porin n=1 Tax=Paraburkholderia tropica TaxID=92647 RepID=A0ABX5MY90_9BURK|nr:porin [Paraburkholderia tropica]MDE1140567.1 porin [Paraburkholderia tropica]PXX19280.1 putative porin [Paraburkholderia tropica]PZW88303.1 putative porin [Paraburkholderia tropica]